MNLKTQINNSKILICYLFNINNILIYTSNIRY